MHRNRRIPAQVPAIPKGKNGCQLFVSTWKAPAIIKNRITPILITVIITLKVADSFIPNKSTMVQTRTIIAMIS